METVNYLNLPNCQRLCNGAVEVIVTTDIGPRIIRYGFVGEDNALGECPEAKVETELGDWRPWGGHRLWTAPEAIPRSYVPDNRPIPFEAAGTHTIRLRPPVEAETGMEKTMTVTLDETGTRVTVHHQITNRNLWAIDAAPWALTILAGGGTVILPQEPYRSHDDCLLPARPMVLWHYTDLSDPRWSWGRKYVQLKVDAALKEPQKIGIANKQGWAGYLRGNGAGYNVLQNGPKTLFVKQFPYQEGATYPDEGCNCEVYTAESFVEVETLAPMHHLEPGGSAEHVEHWYLFRDVAFGDSAAELDETEASLDAALRPLLASITD